MEWEKAAEIGKRWGGVVVVGAVGVMLSGYGVWEAVRPREAVVEIVEEGEHGEPQSIYVDVAGAVERPGVYTLASGSRVGEALAAAGGLSAQADRNYVTRYLNLAEKVADGAKIYVPLIGESESSANQQISESVSHGEGKVNINTASVSELDSLWGIGEARAQAIVDNRPYSSVEELESKAGIPSNVYEVIKERVGVY